MENQEPPTSFFLPKNHEASYSLADLTGQWEANILVSGADTYNWVRGPIDVDPTGAFTVALVDSTGLIDTEGDTFAITPEGLITMQSMPTAQCRMDTSKTIVVCTDTDSDDESAILLTFVKKADLYSMADLTGSWFVHALASGPAHHGGREAPSPLGLMDHSPAESRIMTDQRTTCPAMQAHSPFHLTVL